MDVADFQDRAVLVKRLRPRLAGARRALLFGSVARGEADEWSDLDLVVIADTDRTFFIPTRYPNGLPGGIPAEIFTDSQAEDAVNRARAFIEVARAAISGC